MILERMEEALESLRDVFAEHISMLQPRASTYWPRSDPDRAEANRDMLYLAQLDNKITGGKQFCRVLLLRRLGGKV